MAEKKINGRTFKVEPMLAMQALVLQARLARLAGPAVARLGDIMGGLGSDGTEEERKQSISVATGALADIFAQTQPEEMAAIVREIVELAQMRRESGEYHTVDLDGDMTGHAGDIIPLCVWVLREQFGDFFSGLPALGGPGTRVRH